MKKYPKITSIWTGNKFARFILSGIWTVWKDRKDLLHKWLGIFTVSAMRKDLILAHHVGHQKLDLRPSDFFNVPLRGGLRGFSSKFLQRQPHAFAIGVFSVSESFASRSTWAGHPSVLKFKLSNCFPQLVIMLFNLFWGFACFYYLWLVLQLIICLTKLFVNWSFSVGLYCNQTYISELKKIPIEINPLSSVLCRGLSYETNSASPYECYLKEMLDNMIAEKVRWYRYQFQQFS